MSFRVPLEGDLAPAEALLTLRGDERPFVLVGDWAGGGALLGSSPVRVLGTAEDPFAALGSLEPCGGDAVVGGGWFGTLGYGLGARVERLPAPPPAPVVTPAHRLAFYDHVVRFDGARWWFESLTPEHPRLALWRERLAGPAPARGRYRAGPLSPVAPGTAGHLEAVAECLGRIGDGELFQANLTLRLEGAFAGHALDAFAAALPVARPRFGACFDGVVSLSPERFLRRDARRVETDPVKGTGPDPEALRASAKDAAEHVMIVDLMRNDLGRVCAYGSIAAGAPRMERHGDVFHLVSTVAGELRADAGDGDLLRATFPPGSVTGAPKVQAMKVISELEATRREAYTGAIGYASPRAGLELSVAIRTFEIARGRIWLGVGGGIVADSDPQAELVEALAKAAGPAAAIGCSIRVARRPEVSTRRIPRALDQGPRPDPALGLLETIRTTVAGPRHLAAHLARLAASALELYDLRLPADLRSRIERVRTDARLRVVLTPDGSATLQADPLVAMSPGPLVPRVLPGGLGRHKWADRRLATALGPHVLLIDGDGAVLESTWANVFLVEGERTVTPPADGRILPGTHRARILAEEEPFDLARLEAADAVFLTSSLRRVAARFAAPVARA